MDTVVQKTYVNQHCFIYNILIKCNSFLEYCHEKYDTFTKSNSYAYAHQPVISSSEMVSIHTN